jgi:probable HAF family extracellular repeat protein
LGTLPGCEYSSAQGVSADGSVVVGYAYSFGTREQAFRWTEQMGMQPLEGLPGYVGTVATDVSADGNIVVGYLIDDAGRFYACRWTAPWNAQSLNEVYAHLLPEGTRLMAVSAISADGRYLVGYGWNAEGGVWRTRQEAYLIDTWRKGDTNGDGCIDETDLLAVIFAFGTSGSGTTRHEDINKDGIVDDADLLEVLFAFGQGC